MTLQAPRLSAHFVCAAQCGAHEDSHIDVGAPAATALRISAVMPVTAAVEAARLGEESPAGRDWTRNDAVLDLTHGESGQHARGPLQGLSSSRMEQWALGGSLTVMDKVIHAQNSPRDQPCPMDRSPPLLLGTDSCCTVRVERPNWPKERLVDWQGVDWKLPHESYHTAAYFPLGSDDRGGMAYATGTPAPCAPYALPMGNYWLALWVPEEAKGKKIRHAIGVHTAIALRTLATPVDQSCYQQQCK